MSGPLSGLVDGLPIDLSRHDFGVEIGPITARGLQVRQALDVEALVRAFDDLGITEEHTRASNNLYDLAIRILNQKPIVLDEWRRVLKEIVDNLHLLTVPGGDESDLGAIPDDGIPF